MFAEPEMGKQYWDALGPRSDNALQERQLNVHEKDRDVTVINTSRSAYPVKPDQPGALC